MKLMAHGVRQSGGQRIGVSVEFLHHKVRQEADEMVITANLAERKAQLLERAKGFLPLPLAELVAFADNGPQALKLLGA